MWVCLKDAVQLLKMVYIGFGHAPKMRFWTSSNAVPMGWAEPAPTQCHHPACRDPVLEACSTSLFQYPPLRCSRLQPEQLGLGSSIPLTAAGLCPLSFSSSPPTLLAAAFPGWLCLAWPLQNGGAPSSCRTRCGIRSGTRRRKCCILSMC